MVASSQFKQQLLLREYGRNIKRLVDYVLTIEDRQHRTESAQLLVNLMAQLNPAAREINDVQQKLWNHLYVLSQGKLDVDAPYPLSQMEYLNDKPHRVAYNQRQSKFKHYGQNVEKLIKKATEIEDPEEREAAIISIGKLMKTLYRSYNKDNVTDSARSSQKPKRKRITTPLTQPTKAHTSRPSKKRAATTTKTAKKTATGNS